MTKAELEFVYERLCKQIKTKTLEHERVSNELDALHTEAEDLEYQIANYDDDNREHQP